MKLTDLIHINNRKSISKLLLVITLSCSGLLSYAQHQQVHLTGNNITLKAVFKQIEQQAKLSVDYTTQEVNDSYVISQLPKSSNVKEVMEQLLKDSGCSVTFRSGHIIINKQSGSTGKSDTKMISGVITDAKGEPIIGANVLEKGSTNGTITDLDGKFSLSVPSKSTLVISYIGYTTKSIVVGNQNIINIQLEEDTHNLNEVVVTALGIKREEKALGYAVQKVGGDNFSTIKPVDVATSLTGKVAGLNIQNSPEFNSAPSISLRGSEPLLVIDGVPYGNVSLKDIAADDIESIDVLKGATASALYGARGGAGAIMVTTKRGTKEGLNVTVNSSTMFNAGYLKKPEVQTSYSSGSGGKYYSGDYVWGDKLDIGRTAVQYDPYTHEWKEMPLESKGKNNLKNFQSLSLVTNNNVSVSQKGKYGSVRTSLTHMLNKGNIRMNA